MAEQSRSPVPPATTITDLNEDCIAHCAGHLSLGDVCNLAMASSALKRLAYSDSIWQRFFRSLSLSLLCYSIHSILFLLLNWIETKRGKEHWHLELPWRSSGNGAAARGVYMARHAALRQFMFLDPSFSTLTYPPSLSTSCSSTKITFSTHRFLLSII